MNVISINITMTDFFVSLANNNLSSLKLHVTFTAFLLLNSTFIRIVQKKSIITSYYPLTIFIFALNPVTLGVKKRILEIVKTRFHSSILPAGLLEKTETYLYREDFIKQSSRHNQDIIKTSSQGHIHLLHIEKVK